MNTKTTVYSSKGLSEKINSMELSKKEAAQIKSSIEALQNKSLYAISNRGKIHKHQTSQDLYSYRVNPHTRLVFSTIKGKKSGILLHDIVKIKNNDTSTEKITSLVAKVVEKFIK